MLLINRIQAVSFNYDVHGQPTELQFQVSSKLGGIHKTTPQRRDRLQRLPDMNF